VTKLSKYEKETVINWNEHGFQTVEKTSEMGALSEKTPGLHPAP
jgi:hypothetical protein